MKKKDVETRLWLDHEISELIAFAFEQCGKDGIKYTAKEVRRLVRSMLNNELKAK